MSVEAAERLLDELAALENEYENTAAFPGSADLDRVAIGIRDQGVHLIDEALADARRAGTAEERERIRAAVAARPNLWDIADIYDILYAEAQR